MLIPQYFLPSLSYHLSLRILFCLFFSGHNTQVYRKLFFKTNYRLMQVKNISKSSKGSILQYLLPSLSYHLSLRSLFCLFLSGRFTQVLLYKISGIMLIWVAQQTGLSPTWKPLRPVFSRPVLYDVSVCQCITSCHIN